MLKKEQLRCGIYDSLLSRKHATYTPQRTVRYYELELYHTDNGTSFLDGECYPIRRGMLICTRPGQVRYSQLPLRSSYIWVQPDEDTQAVLDTLPTCTYIEDPETVENLLRLFTQLHCLTVESSPEPEHTVGLNSMFLEILRTCLGLCRGGDKRPMANRLVREAYGYMDKHFCDRCTLEKIAEHIHVSANHLHTVFLQSEGKTPWDYVMEKRIERAKTLILMGEGSMAQIALETGFCSQSHFTAVFKKKTGQTPARYRKQLFDVK